MLAWEIDIPGLVLHFPGSFEHEHDPLAADLGSAKVPVRKVLHGLLSPNLVLPGWLRAGRDPIWDGPEAIPHIGERE
jgi:hypothetical protein